MIFGLFRNKQGEALHEETIRTLNKADELPKKNKKWIAKYLLEKITQYVGELEGLKIPSPEADKILKSHVFKKHRKSDFLKFLIFQNRLKNICHQKK